MSVVMDGSPVVWLELNVLVWVWEETLSPLSELPGAEGAPRGVGTSGCRIEDLLFLLLLAQSPKLLLHV